MSLIRLVRAGDCASTGTAHAPGDTASLDLCLNAKNLARIHDLVDASLKTLPRAISAAPVVEAQRAAVLQLSCASGRPIHDAVDDQASGWHTEHVSQTAQTSSPSVFARSSLVPFADEAVLVLGPDPIVTGKTIEPRPVSPSFSLPDSLSPRPSATSADAPWATAGAASIWAPSTRAATFPTVIGPEVASLLESGCRRILQSILLDVLCPLLNDNQTVLLLAVVETNPRWQELSAVVASSLQQAAAGSAPSQNAQAPPSSSFSPQTPPVPTRSATDASRQHSSSPASNSTFHSGISEPQGRYTDGGASINTTATTNAVYSDNSNTRNPSLQCFNSNQWDKHTPSFSPALALAGMSIHSNHQETMSSESNVQIYHVTGQHANNFNPAALVHKHDMVASRVPSDVSLSGEHAAVITPNGQSFGSHTAQPLLDRASLLEVSASRLSTPPMLRAVAPAKTPPGSPPVPHPLTRHSTPGMLSHVHPFEQMGGASPAIHNMRFDSVTGPVTSSKIPEAMAASAQLHQHQSPYHALSTLPLDLVLSAGLASGYGLDLASGFAPMAAGLAPKVAHQSGSHSFVDESNPYASYSQYVDDKSGFESFDGHSQQDMEELAYHLLARESQQAGFASAQLSQQRFMLLQQHEQQQQLLMEQLQQQQQLQHMKQQQQQQLYTIGQLQLKHQSQPQAPHGSNRDSSNGSSYGHVSGGSWEATQNLSAVPLMHNPLQGQAYNQQLQQHQQQHLHQQHQQHQQQQQQQQQQLQLQALQYQQQKQENFSNLTRQLSPPTALLGVNRAMSHSALGFSNGSSLGQARSGQANTIAPRPLSQPVLSKIDSVVQRCNPFIQADHFDSGARHWLQQLGDEAAIAALENLANASNLKNPRGYAALKLEPGLLLLIDQLVESGRDLAWHHFDPKVLGVIQEMREPSMVAARLCPLNSHDLSGVINVPAYLYTLLSKCGKTAKQAAAAKLSSGGH